MKQWKCTKTLSVVTARAMDDYQKPLVYVIVLNWNAEAVTAECLESLVGLAYPNYRVVLVDNGSSDHSGEVLARRFPDVCLLQMERNLGYTGGNNVGIRKALAVGADYVLLLNNDTTVAPDLLDQLVDIAESDTSIAAVNPKILFADAPDRIWYAAGSYNWWLGMPYYYHKETVDQTPDLPQLITFATGCAMLLRGEALKKVGLFDERFFAYGEDTDLTTRIRKAGYQAVYNPNGVVWHKDGYTIKQQQGIAYKVYLATRNKLLLMAKHATPWQWLVFLPFFCLRHILYYILLGFFKRDLRISLATFTGSYDFFRLNRYSPYVEALPDAN
jgi:GT2 family glycosyltransferase